MKFIYDHFGIILVALFSFIMMIASILIDDYLMAILFAIPFWANIIVLHIKSDS